MTSEGPQPGSPAPPRARARGSCAGGWLRRALSGSDAGRRRWELDEEGDRASERTRALLRTLRTHPRGPAAAGGGRRRAESRRDACDRAGGRPRRACRERTCVGSPWVLGEPRAPAGKTPPGRRAAQCPSSAARGGNSAVRDDAGGAAGPRARRGEPDPGADAALPSVRDPRGRVRGAGREGGRGQPCGHAAEKGRA